MEKEVFFQKFRKNIQALKHNLGPVLRQLFLSRKRLVESYFTNLYEEWGLYKIAYFFRFLSHRYSAKQFDVANVERNLKLLFRLKPEHGLTATRFGELVLLESPAKKILFKIKNILLFNALQKRVEKIVLYTYLTLTIELNNPFDRKKLLFFLEKKVSLLKRLLKYVQTINGKKWDQSEIDMHIRIFERSSLVQAEVIKRMKLAVKRQKVNEILQEAEKAIKKGLTPVLITQGLSGAYWIRGVDRRILGLFKPFDEEIHAPNNPVGPRFQGALGLRKTRSGCRVGESAHREVAAFVVDEFFGFGIVPRTYYAEFSSRVFFLASENRYTSIPAIKTKMGSFQEFVSGFVSSDKLPKEAMDSLSLEEFQLLVLLDVIIGNTDRNIGNILLGDEQIAAIDHGLCFPDTIDTFTFWYWSYFKHGESPLFSSLVELLNNFPCDQLEHRLKAKTFISNAAFQRLRERVALFTEAINLGLVPSQLEDLFTETYLVPLLDLNTTLKVNAKTQAQLYNANLK